jgi:hypothetical protein
VQSTDDVRARHAIISGTGRSGTSFLVRFLSECGVPAGDLESLGYCPEARAGFECNLLHAGDTYLVKDPWLSEYLDDIDLGRITVDVLIMPVRDLRDAATSRVRREIEQWQSHPGFTRNRRLWGAAPGGVVYSLSVADQERILATQQAKVTEWALRHDIPLILLHFPRLVNDGDYLIDALWPWLRHFCDRDAARAAFDAIADPSDVTVSIHRPDDGDVAAQLEAEVHALRAVNRRLSESVNASAAEAARALGEAEAVRAEMETIRDQMGAIRDQMETIRGRLRAIRSSTSYRLARIVLAPIALLRRPFSRNTPRSTGRPADVRRGSSPANRGT